MDYTLKHLAKPVQTKAGEFDPNAKHEQTLKMMAQFGHSTPEYKPKEESLDYVTKKTKVLFVLLPEWAPFFPPFNLARLSAVAKSAGFQSRILDINVKAHNIYMNEWYPTKKLDFRLWNPASSWRWVGANYMTHLHKHFEPILLDCIEKIVE